MTNLNEIWKPINLNIGYEVSNFGRIKRLGSDKGTGHPKSDRIISGSLDVYGYYRVSITNGAEVKTLKVHQLVAIHFIDNPENKKNVNHKDGVKTNNNVSNLEWCTLSENNYHAYDTGLKDAKGTKNGRCKLTEAQVLEIYHSTDLQVPLSKKYNVSQTIISSIKLGKTWSHLTKNIQK